jgi:predicted RNA-binding protein with PIN domain
MPVLLDGNNLLHRLPGKPASRADLRRLVLEACRHQRMRITVVFDGPPPEGAPPREELGAVSVVYAGSETADDVIIRSLPLGRAARDWVVVTDDRELRARARQRGARVKSVAEWSRMKPAPPPRPRAEAKLSSREIGEWEQYFKDGQTDNGE